MDFSVTIGNLVLKKIQYSLHLVHLVMGLNMRALETLKKLGGIVVKGLSINPRQGNIGDRIAETPCGMLNSIGLENIGIHAFLDKKIAPFALEGNANNRKFIW